MHGFPRLLDHLVPVTIFSRVFVPDDGFLFLLRALLGSLFIHWFIVIGHSKHWKKIGNAYGFKKLAFVTSNPTSRCGPLLVFKFSSSSWLSGASHDSKVTTCLRPLLVVYSTSYTASTPENWSCWLSIVISLMSPTVPLGHLWLSLRCAGLAFKLFAPILTKDW